jgi:hypothetical protein
MNITQNTQFDLDNAYEYVIRSIKRDIGYNWGIFKGKRLIVKASDKDSLIECLRKLGFSYRDKNMFMSQTIVTYRTDYNILLLDSCLDRAVYSESILSLAVKLEKIGCTVVLDDNTINVFRNEVQIGSVDVTHEYKYGKNRWSMTKTKSINVVLSFFKA